METVTAVAESRFRLSCHNYTTNRGSKKWDVEPRKPLKIHGVKPD